MLPTSTLYKLTTPDATSVEGYTGNYTPIYTEWGEGVEHVVPPGGRLYTDQVLHAYRAPMIAVFMDPVRGDYTHDDDALLWECEGDVCADDGALVGCTRLRALRRIPLPTLTLEERIDIAIRAARIVCYDDAFCQWASDWLSGSNRSPEAARAVRDTMPEVAREPADEAAHAALRTVSAPLWAGDLREAMIRSSAGEAAEVAAQAAMAKGVRFDLLDICRQHVARRAVSLRSRGRLGYQDTDINHCNQLAYSHLSHRNAFPLSEPLDRSKREFRKVGKGVGRWVKVSGTFVHSFLTTQRCQ